MLQKRGTKSIWKHGRKGQLHGYKAAGAPVDESPIDPAKASGDSIGVSVNRSATATKVKGKGALQDVRKLNACKAHQIVQKQKVKAGFSSADKGKDLGIHKDTKTSNQGQNGVSKRDRHKEKDSDGAASSCIESSSKGHKATAQVETKSLLIIDQTPNDTGRKVPPGRKTEDAKAATLEKLIKKAGVEDKLKEFKTATGNGSTKSQNRGSVITSKSTCQLSSKIIAGKRPQSGNTSQSLQIVGPGDTNPESNQTQHSRNSKTSVSVISKSRTQGESKDIQKFKSAKPYDSITNQKRKQILSGKENQSTEPPKVNVCDEEVQKWLKTLKLRETQKYIDTFAEHEINMQNARLLTRNDLREMGISALGPLNSLCSAIDTLNKEKEVEARHQEAQGKVKSKTKSQSKAKQKARKVGTVVVEDEVKNEAKEEGNDTVSSKATTNVKKSDDKRKGSKGSQIKTKSGQPSPATLNGKMKCYYFLHTSNHLTLPTFT